MALYSWKYPSLDDKLYSYLLQRLSAKSNDKFWFKQTNCEKHLTQILKFEHWLDIGYKPKINQC